ncbi:MAG TPA: monovalent cation/H+ antiporter complex subunit F [Planctomycetaceae bacterium]|nr:monovalent cation/H+ antiporter complex subunit F [Planctomycetaceae bacterium]
MMLAVLDSYPYFTDAVLMLLGLSLMLTFLRLILGPTLPDRVVALDLIGIITAGIIGVLAIENEQPVYLIVAVVLALIAFIGTIAFAFYIAKGGAE